MSENLMCSEQRVVSENYRQGYDSIQWSACNENKESEARNTKESEAKEEG